MMKNNIETIKKFIKSNNQNLLINQLNEDIGCFYETVIREFSKKNDVSVINYVGYNANNNEDLFSNKKLYLFTSTNSRQIEEISNNNSQNIILTDYKNYKKFSKNIISINGYDFEKDLRYLLNQYFKIRDETIINYCISSPYFVFSEVSKYSLNSKNYIADTRVKEVNNFILSLRKDMFKLKNNSNNIKKLFQKLKLEVNYKKFNFLTY